MNFREFLKESQQWGSGNRGHKVTGKLSKDDEAALARDSKLKQIKTSAGITIVPSIHAQARAVQRRNDFSPDDWKKLGRKVAWAIKDKKIKSGSFLFYNDETSQGFVGNVKNGGKEIAIITVYPRGSKDAQYGKSGKLANTQLMVVEQNWFSDYLKEVNEDLALNEFDIVIDIESVRII